MARNMKNADEPEMAQAYEEMAASAASSPGPDPMPTRLRQEADLCPKCGPRFVGPLAHVLVSSS